MRRHIPDEETSHPERWLVSYADFMTLMFALFVVLFASSYHDKRTIERVSKAVKNGFQEMGSFSTSKSAADTPPDLSNASDAPRPTGNGVPLVTNKANESGIDVVELNRKLTKALGKEIERREVDMRTTPEGFVISLHELGFFDSGQAELLPGASDKIQRIAAVLMQYGLDMRVEGHSDNVPIHNASFSSNWDLSTARAMAVAKMLLNESGFDPKRLSVAGYAEYRPAASNDTAEGRRKNRRVDIVILSLSKPSEAKAPSVRLETEAAPSEP
jgi:chemotaxis protein MotB